MSLGGLSLAAGMLVDNSIVVLENISRHLAARREGGSEEPAEDGGRWPRPTASVSAGGGGGQRRHP